MELGGEGLRKEVGSYWRCEGNDPKYGASMYKLAVIVDMVASWHAMYDISSSVIMIIPEPSDRANSP